MHIEDTRASVFDKYISSWMSFDYTNLRLFRIMNSKSESTLLINSTHSLRVNTGVFVVIYVVQTFVCFVCWCLFCAV